MENATKALLIAAAVLVAILLIAFGMRIMRSTTTAGTQAGQVGEEMSTKTDAAADAAKTSIKGIDTTSLEPKK